jgi:chromosome segregation ATPase
MSEIKYEDIYYMLKDVAFDQEDPTEAYKKIENEIDHWKAEAERYEPAWRSVASDYNMILAEEQLLRKKVESLTAERDRYKAEMKYLAELLEDSNVTICKLCKRLNPQHENCTGCSDLKTRNDALAKIKEAGE